MGQKFQAKLLSIWLNNLSISTRTKFDHGDHCSGGVLNDRNHLFYILPNQQLPARFFKTEFKNGIVVVVAEAAVRRCIFAPDDSAQSAALRASRLSYFAWPPMSPVMAILMSGIGCCWSPVQFVPSGLECKNGQLLPYLYKYGVKGYSQRCGRKRV